MMLMTQGGMLVRIAMTGVRDIGRNTQGVRLIRVKDGDQLIGAELVEEADEDSEAVPVAELVDDSEAMAPEAEVSEEEPASDDTPKDDNNS